MILVALKNEYNNSSSQKMSAMISKSYYQIKRGIRKFKMFTPCSPSSRDMNNVHMHAAIFCNTT